MSHSILPPSGASAWRYCAMWVSINQAYPQPDTPESMEGTAAHWAFSEMLYGRPVALGQVAPNGIVLTDEMIDGADLVVEVVRERMRGCGAIRVEQPVNIPRIHAQCWGTPDIWGFDSVSMTLHVIDYKFGHRFVDEFENDQGVAYVDGIIEFLANECGQGAGWLDQQLTVNFTVIQPRCFYKGSSVRTWTFKASEIRAQINILAAAAQIALQPNPIATTNAACRDCSGRHVCPALQKAAYSDAEFAVKSSPMQLTPEAASLELRMLQRSLERLQSRVEGLDEVVTSYAKQGHRIPFHRLETSEGRTRWNIPNDHVVAIGESMGVKLGKGDVVTPKQAIKAGIDAAVVSAFSTPGNATIKLVADNPNDVKRIFK